MPKNTTSSATSNREAAIYGYTSAGFSLFPCGTSKDAKAPQIDGWQATSYDPLLEPDSLPEMYGVVLRDEDLVLDVDPRRFKNGINELHQLCAKLGIDKLDTFVVSTGGGGIHAYFKKPKSIRLLSRIPGFPAIEVKSAGLYVIGAGSRHDPETCRVPECLTCPAHDGRPYEIQRKTPADSIEAPEALLQLVDRGASLFNAVEEGVCDDDDANKGRFIRYCLSTAPAVQGDGGERTTFKVACEGRDYGLSQESVFDIMRDYFSPRCLPEWVDDELKQKVGNAYHYATGVAGRNNPQAEFRLLSTEIADKIKSEETAKIRWDVYKTGAEAGQFKPTLINVVNFFRLAPQGTYANPIYGLLRYNMFADQVEFVKPAPWHDARYPKQFWSDEDAIQLKEWLQQEKNLAVATNTVHEAAVVISRKEQYHPVRDYLEGLRWDRVARLDRLLIDYFGTPDSPYARTVGKCTIIAAVARVMKPGCQHDHILVLEGQQGTGKSTAVRILGGEFYADIHIDPHQKDTVAGMQGAWFMEASEMEFTRRADVSALKAFLTRTSDKVRLAYARTPVTLPRQSLFIGTVNPGSAGYLQDSTGNRRFWPVKTTLIQREKLTRDRDQIFAEALVRFRQGEAWHITDKAIEDAAANEQAARVAIDAWEEVITGWVTLNYDELPKPLTTETVANWALNLSAAKLGRTERARIVDAMTKAGFRSEKVWDAEYKAQIRQWVRDPVAEL